MTKKEDIYLGIQSAFWNREMLSDRYMQNADYLAYAVESLRSKELIAAALERFSAKELRKVFPAISHGRSLDGEADTALWRDELVTHISASLMPGGERARTVETIILGAAILHFNFVLLDDLRAKTPIVVDDSGRSIETRSLALIKGGKDFEFELISRGKPEPILVRSGNYTVMTEFVRAEIQRMKQGAGC